GHPTWVTIPCLDFIELALVAFINRRKTVSVKTEMVARTRSERERGPTCSAVPSAGAVPLWCRGEDESKNARKQGIRQTKCEILSPFSGYWKKVLIALVRHR